MTGNSELTYDQLRLLKKENDGMIRFFTLFTAVETADRAEGLAKAGYLEKMHAGFWLIEYRLTPAGRDALGSYK